MGTAIPWKMPVVVCVWIFPQRSLLINLKDVLSSLFIVTNLNIIKELL